VRIIILVSVYITHPVGTHDCDILSVQVVEMHPMALYVHVQELA